MRTKVLLIEENVFILGWLKRVLKEGGYFVEGAGNVHDGILAFDRGRFDIVISDLSMPFAKGNKLSQHIRSSRTPDVPIVGLVEERWLRDGRFDLTLNKPFSSRTLLSELENLQMRAALKGPNRDGSPETMPATAPYGELGS